jgi:hypothetical protein
VRESERQRIVAEETADEWPYEAWSNPVSAMLGTYLLGVLLHMADVSPWWPLLTGLAVTVTWVGCTVSLGTKDLGVGYAAAVSLSVTGWLTWAAGHPTLDIRNWPVTRDSWWILGTATAILAVVWGVLIRQRANAVADVADRLRGVTGQGDSWEDACRQAGIAGWEYESQETTPGGMKVTMRIRPGGTTYRQALGSVERLESCVEAPYHGAVRIEKGANAARAVIVWNERNMLAEVLPYPDDMSPTDIVKPMTTGMFEDRIPATVTYAYRSSLTLGQRDGGKSNENAVKIANLVRAPNVLIWLSCFKQGSAAKPWLAPYAAGQASAPALDWVTVCTPADMAGVEAQLDALDRIGNERARRRTSDKIVPTPEQPAIRLNIDEIADLLADPRNYRIAAKLVLVLRKHRSEGIDLDLASQRGTMSFLGQWARDIASQVSIVNVFKVDNPAEVWNALGLDRSRIGGIDPSTFEYQGTMLTVAPGARIAPQKVFRINHDDPLAVPKLAAAGAAHRPVLEQSAVAAAGPQYARRWQTDQVRALLVDAARIVGGQYQPAHVPAVGHATIPAPVPAQVAGPPRLRAVPYLDPTSNVPVERQLGLHKIDGRQILVDQFGPVEGEKAWQFAQGYNLLVEARRILAATPDRALPTRDLLDQLALRPKWDGLTPERLADLVRPHGVKPDQLGASRFPGNPRGYRLSSVEEALRQPAEDSPTPA